MAFDTYDDLTDDSVDYPYEKFILDSDTALFRASKFVQEDYIKVTFIKKGSVKEFKNKTEFYGHWKKKQGGWLAEQNEKIIAKGKTPLKVEDFKIEEHTRLLDEIDDHIEEGVKNFDMFIGGIKKLKLAPEYVLCIGGDNNYRYDFAETLKYKGDRPEKPILFTEIRDKILDKYGNKVIVVDGREADDRLAVFGKENEEHFDKTGDWKYVLGYIDKDLEMIHSPSINLDKLDDGVVYRDKVECVRKFAIQMLIGDIAVDNIAGLPNLVEELRVKHGVRKGNSLGKTTAINYLKTADSIKELLERVVEAYKSYYGEGEFEYRGYKGIKTKSTWLDRLNEVSVLTFMNYYDDPLDYHVTDTLEEFGVEYA